jgi:CheY-like chemotaxis protein
MSRSAHAWAYNRPMGPLQAASLRGVRVLVVDDQPDAVEAVCEFLRMEGAEVLFTSSATEGLSEAPLFRPHAVVADVSMPVVDGYSFLARLRALPAESGGSAPALALTAMGFPEHEDWARQAGFARLIQKPAAPDVIARAIADLVRIIHEETTGVAS